nr:integrase, catalytic region, zinc finger, CCHC-type, peptidase aspartic, catalytic [Tanacetum cinerariifolium]
MHQKIERLHAQLGDLKGKSKDTSYVSYTLNPLSQKLENKNVELEFQVLNYAKENAHLKTTYKNLNDSISVRRTQTKTIIDSLQNKIHDTIYENAKLRAQLLDKVSDQKDTASGTSANTKFGKQSILGKPPKVGETRALSKPVTSNSISTPQGSKVMKNVNVIAPGMFRINPFKPSREEKHRHVLVIVDDFSRYTWVQFLRSKDEATEVIKTFLKRITILFQSLVIIIRTDNGTKFKNQILKEYFDSVGISHQVSSVRTPQQNRVVKQRNQTLVEAARTMLIFSRAPLFLWAEAIATACFTQNRPIIHRRFNKTPYELINRKKPDISFLHVFGALCYPKNDRKDIGKLGAKGDIGFFIGYFANSCAFRV